LQFVPQPSATNSQALSKAFTARVSAYVWVSQGDHAKLITSASATKIDDESFLGILSPFLQVTPNAVDEFLIKGISNSEKPYSMSP
jgi:hypothetical protein